MRYLQRFVRNSPEPLVLGEAGHFVQEWGEEVAAAALAAFAGERRMRAYVAVTDPRLYRFLRARPHFEEVNFWQPSGSRGFRALEPGEPFLFKLHSPDDFIVGGGFFAASAILPVGLRLADLRRAQRLAVARPRCATRSAATGAASATRGGDAPDRLHRAAAPVLLRRGGLDPGAPGLQEEHRPGQELRQRPRRPAAACGRRSGCGCRR